METDAALADKLRLSNDTLQIANYSFYISCNLWRDFMPEAPKNGKPLICSIRLTEKNSLPIPADLKLIGAYVINRNDIWINSFDDINNENINIIEGVSRYGPKWGPDISVDVVCEFREDGIVYKVIARQQKITATY